MSYISGKIIKELRESKNLTKKQLGEIISVSDKTVSKWETEKGLPDITLIEPLSKALGVSVAELLSGERIVNKNRAGNIKDEILRLPGLRKRCCRSWGRFFFLLRNKPSRSFRRKSGGRLFQNRKTRKRYFHPL